MYIINFFFQRYAVDVCSTLHFLLEGNVTIFREGEGKGSVENSLYNNELRNTRQNITDIKSPFRYKNGRESTRKFAAGNIRQHYPIMYVSSRTHYCRLSGVSAKLHLNESGVGGESPFINHDIMNETSNRRERYVMCNYEN